MRAFGRRKLGPWGGTAAALLLLAGCAGSSAPPVEVVQDFQADRYLGEWHQIAFAPNRFQEDCVADTRATYRAGEDGRIRVLNACDTADGERDEAEGRARFTGATDEGALEVTFVDIFGTWFWPAAGDYRIVALDPAYRWSLVVSPAQSWAWILAREPELDDATLVRLRGRLERAGIDPCRLVMTAEGRDDKGRSLCAVGAASA